MNYNGLWLKKLTANAFTTTLFLIIGCASTGNKEQSQSQVMVQTADLLKGVKKVAVLDFEGYEQDYAGRAVAAEIIVKLTVIGNYDVVEREQLKRILDEHALYMSGIIAPDTAKVMGNILGADALIMGKVISWTVEEKEVMQEDWSKFLGVLVDKSYDTRSPHIFRHAYVKVLIKVANVEHGTVQTAGIYEKRIKQVERMTDSYGKMLTKQELLQKCVGDIANQFLMSVKPEAQIIPKGSSQINSTLDVIQRALFYSGGSKLFKEANKYAMRQLWPEAKELWEKALIESQEKKGKKDIAGAHFNLGLFYEAIPNYERSEQEYKYAYETDNNDMFLDRLSLVRKKREANGNLLTRVIKEQPEMIPPSDSIVKIPEKDPFYMGASKYFKEGQKYAARQLWAEAKESWGMALKESQEKNYKKDMAGAYHNLGLYYMAISNFGIAEEEFKTGYGYDSKVLYLDRLAEARLQHEASERIERAKKKENQPSIGPPSDSINKGKIKKKQKKK